MTTLFIWWNLLFPYLDLAFTLAFIPGWCWRLFGIYWLAGPLTLFLLPLAGLVNLLMFRVQSRMFTQQGLHVRRNVAGFLFYALCYSFVLQPACVIGYVQEAAEPQQDLGHEMKAPGLPRRAVRQRHAAAAQSVTGSLFVSHDSDSFDEFG